MVPFVCGLCEENGNFYFHCRLYWTVLNWFCVEESLGVLWVRCRHRFRQNMFPEALYGVVSAWSSWSVATVATYCSRLYSGELHATHGQRRTTFLRVETGATPAHSLPPLPYREISSPRLPPSMDTRPRWNRSTFVVIDFLTTSFFSKLCSYLRPRQMRNCFIHRCIYNIFQTLKI